MGLISMCTGSKFNPLEEDRDWEPLHTKIIKPMNENHKTLEWTETGRDS